MEKNYVINAGFKGYGQAGASRTKRNLKNFNPMSGSPREDIDDNNYTLRQRSRMLAMSAPVATSAIKTSRTNTIGLGLKLNPRPDGDILGLTPEQVKEWERKVKAEFRIWAEHKRNCDSTAMNDFYEIQQLCFYSWLVSGDVLVLRKEKEVLNCPYHLKLHVIEADRCSTPVDGLYDSLLMTEGVNKTNENKIYDGVEVDADGAVVAYHIRNTYPYQATTERTKWIRVDAYGEKSGLPNVLHVMNAERPEQYRGVSYLAPVIEELLQMRRYTEAELTAATVESFLTAFIKTTEDASKMPFNKIDDEIDDVQDEDSRYDPNEYEMGPGMVNVMNPGEDVEFVDPKRPASGFDNFLKAICSQIGAALEIPADLLLKKFDASYSASRAALLEAWKAFKMYRQWFISDFCNPVYEIWLSEAIARGRVEAPGFFEDALIREAWLRCEWIGPSQGQLDPVKEVNAEILAIQNGLTTHEAAAARINGSDWDTNMNQLEMENDRMAALKEIHTTVLQEKEEEEEDDESI
ncbi:MAG: phage portal protein [Bacillus sp. (in: Bacteria)]|nr:phage portal protein [Bacillus sp. (in: firmicutes)]MCM1427119.1 phage portal protein [Eubacterium sp.]